ncbi:ATP synthase protein I [Endobacter medicaginis]|uniref:ATP synthase protein I n=1 Tax=Endobacter medicaginis TaxID=1181271 RepID=A0A839V1H6_9PROT|nr:AtpZ/AtpI family protein [Endobacter medicaginis]MBB3174705.1 ATP synthase protein I [Endobacter medicaginis]MCX5474900.1 AtpZ/AtpI family protein [Endobacter medicaginis]NVN29497.1 AtpZ/AtpI family protein [Endobacter medicaginis]
MMDDRVGNAGHEPARADFERRLASARAQQGLDPAPGPAQGDAGTGQGIGLALRLAAELVAGLVAGLAIGWGLDRWLHTRPIFIIVFVILGFAAGIVNVMRIMAPPRRT